MSHGKFRIVLTSAGMALLLLLGWMAATASRYPIALIRVQDAVGHPIRGAEIKPDGMRTKPGPYGSGHYGWPTTADAPPAAVSSTDANGIARVPYPRFVFERIETGQISFSIDHPDFVPDRPFRVVTTAPPAGAPWKFWADYLLDRLKNRALIARTEPVLLQRGAIVQLTLAGGSPTTNHFYAQHSGSGRDSDNFWTRPAPGVLVSHQVEPGQHWIRVVQFDGEGVPSFSDLVSVQATTNQATELHLEVHRGVDLLGKIDPSIPRPIKRGRVIAHVTPASVSLKDDPPQWHSWCQTDEQGNFRFTSMPSGLLEIYAICDGFISTNPPARRSEIIPHRHEIGTNSLSVIIPMEPTVRLEVTVLDPDRKPLQNAKILTWPNIRYGDWAATVLPNDCYNTADFLRRACMAQFKWESPAPDFEGVSDSNGLAIVPNLPANVGNFEVEHDSFQLPAIDDGTGRKIRRISTSLTVGRTNRATVKLEPLNASQIAHY